MLNRGEGHDKSRRSRPARHDVVWKPACAPPINNSTGFPAQPGGAINASVVNVLLGKVAEKMAKGAPGECPALHAALQARSHYDLATPPHKLSARRASFWALFWAESQRGFTAPLPAQPQLLRICCSTSSTTWGGPTWVRNHVILPSVKACSSTLPREGRNDAEAFTTPGDVGSLFSPDNFQNGYISTSPLMNRPPSPLADDQVLVADSFCVLFRRLRLTAPPRAPRGDIGVAGRHLPHR